ncbi:MAG: 30S ribosomal protein S21 [Candidatus Pelagibacter sp.]|nr:30S ribosomal protein S21 [Candidatus Pelagibacter sp.]|tara:strand:- start:112 stop:435 length:324 start_codon:yes stop_codon:yes gene_type:complete
MADFSDMLKKAKEMQEKFKAVQNNMKSIEVEGTSGGNLVKLTLNGDYEIKSIILSDEAKNEKTEILLDLIIAAYNSAKDNLKKKSNEEISKITGGINLPGDLNFPFK